MWLLVKTAWRNLFRQRRRTLITTSAMAVSLALAIPTYGLTEGLNAAMLKGITGMDLGHIQIHDPAYPRGRALQSALQRPGPLLEAIRADPRVVAAAARVHGYALASHDVKVPVKMVGLKKDALERLEAALLFGRRMKTEAPWRRDRALACEALISRAAAQRYRITVGMVLTPGAARPGRACERVRIVGQTRVPLPQGGGSLVVGMALEDAVRAFGMAKVSTHAILRHAAPIAIVGIEPDQERRITFMADKVVKGRYLRSDSRSEIVVGSRLAHILRLEPGAKVFLQAASLDATSGAFYRELRVVGVYKTGVDMIDRSRVFVHIADARAVMSLGKRAHEIVVRTNQLGHLAPVVRQLREEATTRRLSVTTTTVGTRGGSRPLVAPVTVFQPGDSGEATPLVPYDLKRRFDQVPGLARLARRVYGSTDVANAQGISTRVRAVSRATLAARLGHVPAAGRCAVHVPSGLARRWGIKPSQYLPVVGARDGGGCARVRVASVYAGAPVGDATLLTLASDGDEDDDTSLAVGALRLLVPVRPRRLRFVGVEPGAERMLSGLADRVSVGTYLPDRADPAGWRALLTAKVAASLSVAPGATLLVHTRDADKRQRWRPVIVAGVVRSNGWADELPEMLLPYYQAQQVDAPRLNARAHELLLLPKPGVEPAALAREAGERLTPLVRTWEQIAPNLARIIKLQDTMTAVLLFIILGIAAVTVMNTMLMAVFERTKEFGVLKSLGMRPRQVFGLIVFETFFIALLAAAVGGAVGFGLDYYLAQSGLDLSSFTGGFSYEGTFIDPIWKSILTVKSIFLPVVMVAFLCLLVSFYPALRAGRLRPVQALRHQG